MLRIGQSWLAGLDGDGAVAVARAREALQILEDFHGGEQGTAFYTLARGLALQEDDNAANEAYGRAVDLLAIHGRRRDAAEAVAAWASFAASRGRGNEAAAILRRAADLGLEPDAEANRIP
jgi:hypothetical protein